MKLFFVNPYFPPYAPGGAEYSLKLLCEHLANKGFQIRVLTNCFDGCPGIREVDGYQVEYLECPVMLQPGQDIDASAYIFSKYYQEKVVATLQKYSKDNSKPDILIANNAPSFIPVAKAGVEFNIPTVGIVRDTQVVCETGACIDGHPAQFARPCVGISGSAACMLKFQRERGHKHLKSVPGILFNGIKVGLKRNYLNRHGTHRLDYLVAISDALRQLLIKGPGVNEDQVKTIGNFSTNVDPATFQEVELYLSQYQLQANRYFIVAGKKSYGKGSDLAARAIQDLSRRRPDIKLLFVGKGHVSEKKNSLFVDNPSVSQEMLMGLLQKSLGLLIPGRWQEGLHRTMVDALRYGIPVICTDVGGPPENIVNCCTGYVVPCESYKDLSNAMQSRVEWNTEKLVSCKEKETEIFNNKFSDIVLMNQWKGFLRSILE